MTEQWDAPVPLGYQRRALPAFPVDALPGWLAQQVGALAEFTQTPADLAGSVALAVLATAAGGRAVVEVRGSWREPTNLYTVVSLPPGSRKSAVFAEMTAPLLETEHDLVEATRPQVLEAETQLRVAQRAAERAAAKAGTVEDDQKDAATADAIAAASMAEAITVPTLPRLVADDITVEATASLLAEQGGRLSVLSAEGGVFQTLAGRYSGMPSLEVFLKGHAGDMLRVDRKGRPPEHVPHPALTLGLCVQPQVLTDIAQMPGFRGRGLLARILYALPPNMVGHRKIGADPVPDDVAKSYAEHVRALVMSLAEWTDPAVLTLTGDAHQVVLDAERALEPRLAEDADLGSIVDWASKLVGATVRVAGLLHLAENIADGWQRPISGDTMRRAVRIGAYYTDHALAAFGSMVLDEASENAAVILEWLNRIKPTAFRKRDLFAAVSRSRFPKATTLDPVLDLLEEHGYIRRRPDPERTGRGRPPSPTYDVHPAIHGQVVTEPQTGWWNA